MRYVENTTTNKFLFDSIYNLEKKRQSKVKIYVYIFFTHKFISRLQNSLVNPFYFTLNFLKIIETVKANGIYPKSTRSLLNYYKVNNYI